MASPLLDSIDQFELEKKGYNIHRQIAEGSFSKVFSATYLPPNVEGKQFPKNIKIELACKFLKTNQMPADYVKKFLRRELEIIGKLSHPHIIFVHSVLQRGSKFFIFMRLAEYGNLCDFLLTQGPIKEKVARIWSRQIAIALIYLQKLEVVHRDVKCENILITANHNAKLTDFGFCRSTYTEKNKPVISQTFCGTVPYAAPELIKGKPYDPKLIDVWSLGIVLYVMVNRMFPFSGDSLPEIWKDQINKNYKFKEEVIKNSSPELINVVGVMLEPECSKRIFLEEFVKSKWIAENKKLLEISDMEKAAFIRADRVKKRPKEEESDVDLEFLQGLDNLSVNSQTLNWMRNIGEVDF